jgi:hypothetical protein
MTVKEITSTILGFFVATIVAGILFTIIYYITDYSEIHTSDYIYALSLIGFGFSAVTTVLFGLPAFILFRHFRLVRWWSALLFGFFVGALIGLGFASPGLSQSTHTSWLELALPNFIGLGITGAISALSFWIIWRLGCGARS